MQFCVGEPAPEAPWSAVACYRSCQASLLTVLQTADFGPKTASKLAARKAAASRRTPKRCASATPSERSLRKSVDSCESTTASRGRNEIPENADSSHAGNGAGLCAVCLGAAEASYAGPSPRHGAGRTRTRHFLRRCAQPSSPTAQKRCRGYQLDSTGALV